MLVQVTPFVFTLRVLACLFYQRLFAMKVTATFRSDPFPSSKTCTSEKKNYTLSTTTTQDMHQLKTG